jgi:hypothetical protein
LVPDILDVAMRFWYQIKWPRQSANQLRVLKNHNWHEAWTANDEDADYDVLLTRKFLFELAGARGLTN